MQAYPTPLLLIRILIMSSVVGLAILFRSHDTNVASVKHSTPVGEIASMNASMSLALSTVPWFSTIAGSRMSLVISCSAAPSCLSVCCQWHVPLWLDDLGSSHGQPYSFVFFQNCMMVPARPAACCIISFTSVIDKNFSMI